MAYHRVRYGTSSSGQYDFVFSRHSDREEAIYDDAGIAQIGTRHHVTMRGLLTGSTVEEFKAKLYEARGKLMTPRKALEIAWSSDNSTWYTTFAVDPNGDDIDWGPRPVSFDYDEIVGGLSAFVTYQVTAVRKDRWISNYTIPGAPISARVLSLVREQSYAVDEVGYTTRTISGTLVVSSPEVQVGRNADAWRKYCAPVLPKNFQRHVQHWDLSPDGRTLRFSIVDHEVEHTLPQPLAIGRAQWQARVRGMGGMADYALTGEFTAPPGTPKSEILKQIGNLALARFPTKDLIWDERSMREDVYGTNTVSFNFLAHGAAVIDNSGKGVNWLASFGKTPPGSNGTAHLPDAYGASGLKADSPVAYDINSGEDPRRTTSQQGTRSNLGDGGTERPRQGGGTLTFQTLSQEHQSAPYVAYSEIISYEVDNRIVCLPAKKYNVNPIVMQTGNPVVRVIQVGYATRHGKLSDMPRPPAFMYDKHRTRWKLESSSPEALAPEPLAVAGQYALTCRWRYVGVLAISISSDGFNRLEAPYPLDPRTSGQPAAGNKWGDLPEQIEKPSK
jgi:hypothetical protein